MAHRKKIRIRTASTRRKKKHKKRRFNLLSERDNALYNTLLFNHCIGDMFEIIDKNITQGRLYSLAGRTDDVCTLDLGRFVKPCC
jgi:hypothetical protein